LKSISPILDDPFGGDTDLADESNDTIDESSAAEVLSSKLAAQVLEAAQATPRSELRRSSAPPKASETVRPRRATDKMAPAGTKPEVDRTRSESMPPRGTLGIPASNTIPTSAKPNLAFPDEGPSAAPQAQAPTPGFRDRVPPSLFGDQTPLARRPALEIGSGQARVPTMVVRDRILPNDSDPSLSEVRAHEPYTSNEEGSAANLVIPIPDEELDRAARRRRFVSAFMIIAAVILAVLIGAYVVVVLVLGKEIPLDPRMILVRAVDRLEARSSDARPGKGTLYGRHALGRAPTSSAAASQLRGVRPPRAGTSTLSVGTTSRAAGEDARARLHGQLGVTEVRIKVRPTSARVVADGRVLRGDVIEVGAKPVEVQITAPGYIEERRTIEPGSSTQLNVLLRRKHR
jgi:hypothetical protein